MGITGHALTVSKQYGDTPVGARAAQQTTVARGLLRSTIVGQAGSQHNGRTTEGGLALGTNARMAPLPAPRVDLW